MFLILWNLGFLEAGEMDCIGGLDVSNKEKPRAWMKDVIYGYLDLFRGDWVRGGVEGEIWVY